MAVDRLPARTQSTLACSGRPGSNSGETAACKREAEPSATSAELGHASPSCLNGFRGFVVSSMSSRAFRSRRPWPLRSVRSAKSAVEQRALGVDDDVRRNLRRKMPCKPHRLAKRRFMRLRWTAPPNTSPTVNPTRVLGTLSYSVTARVAGAPGKKPSCAPQNGGVPACKPVQNPHAAISRWLLVNYFFGFASNGIGSGLQVLDSDRITDSGFS